MDAKALSQRLIGVICLLTVAPVLGQAQEPATIWSFLGIPQAYDHLHGALTNRKGKHPGLEKKPALTELADPANLESEVPVIKKAAEIKKAEDEKKQKIKSIRYLTEVGCGCYDTDGSITEALLAASSDCTEEVRLTTVRSIGEAASKACCANCGETCCCNKKVLLRLAEMAYERDDTGCYLEPSARVREAAAVALQACCPGTAPLMMEDSDPGPKRETVDEPHEAIESDPPPPPPGADASALDNARGGHQATRLWVSDSSGHSAPRPLGDLTGYLGVIVHADAAHRLAHIHLDQPDMQLPVGTRLSVHPKDGGGARYRGELVVVQAFPGSANVRPVNEAHMAQFQPGCTVNRAETRVARRLDTAVKTR